LVNLARVLCIALNILYPAKHLQRESVYLRYFHITPAINWRHKSYLKTGPVPQQHMICWPSAIRWTPISVNQIRQKPG